MEVKRTDRLNELIRETVAEVLLRYVKDPRVQGVTVTGAVVSPDLRHAKIFFTVHDGGQAFEKAKKGLQSAEHHIRAELSKVVKLKYIPHLVFIADQAIEEGMKIDALIKHLHEGTEEHDKEQ